MNCPDTSIEHPGRFALPLVPLLIYFAANARTALGARAGSSEYAPNAEDLDESLDCTVV